jgi:hypothetical protein
VKKETLILLIAFLSASCNTLIHVFYKTPSRKIESICFDLSKESSSFPFLFPDTTGNLFLRQIRVENGLSQLVEHAKSDKEKTLIILNWTHNLWSHSGVNTPSQGDALTIIKEARQGSKFRCVEYGVVSFTALLSIGMKARGLGLQARDIETCKIGGAHYLAEVWLSDLNKWALIDGQFNVMPVLNGLPLNAVEFQKAIIDKQAFVLMNMQGEITGKERSKYLNFISVYLYYFDVYFDNLPHSAKDRFKVDGKNSLMLVPLKAKNPTVFQRNYPNDDFIYTHSLKDFYRMPI